MTLLTQDVMVQANIDVNRMSAQPPAATQTAPLMATQTAPPWPR